MKQNSTSNKPNMEETESKAEIMIVEDQTIIAEDMRECLENRGYSITSIAASGQEAVEAVRQSSPDLILMDIVLLGNMDGIEAAREIGHISPVPIIFITAYSNSDMIERAKEVFPAGYLVKPYREEELVSTIEIALHKEKKKGEKSLQKSGKKPERKDFHRLLGKSLAIKKIRSQIETVAPTDCSVLIYGETGTGKELIARSIHDQSLRCQAPLVAINCGALPDDLIEMELFGHRQGAFTGANQREIGKFELAQGGTLFLDEIGELPLRSQAKLLRVLEEGEYYPLGSSELLRPNVRILATTNRDLRELTQKGDFRKDLFFRLEIYSIHALPLRERKEDISLLALHFLKKFSHKHGKDFSSISPQALSAMKNYHWEGNVRELRNLIERVVISYEGPTLEVFHLENYFQPSSFSTPPLVTEEKEISLSDRGLDAMLGETEKKLILKALEETEGNKTEAAKLLKLSLAAFYYRLAKYDIN